MSHGLPKEKNTLEQEKFADDPDLHTVVKTLAKIYGGTVTANEPPPNDFKITTQLVTDAAAKAPTTPAVNRLGVQIDNYDPNNKVYYGPDSGVTADLIAGTTSGGQIVPNGSQNFGLSGGKDVYVKCEATKTAMVQIIEWIRTP